MKKNNIVIMDHELKAVVELHKAVYSSLGEVVRVFHRDGFPCVQYSTGNWWHYDVKKKTWF